MLRFSLVAVFGHDDFIHQHIIAVFNVVNVNLGIFSDL